MSVYIIAEAGVNHNGCLDTAKKLIAAAAAAKCDAVKFQMFTAEKLVTQSAQKAQYQIQNTGNNNSQFSMLKALEFTKDEWKILKECCDNEKIEFLSTPFDEEAADFLEQVGMCLYKLPSGEITNENLLKHIAKKNKPIILSTGMSTMEEILRAVTWIQEYGNNKISLLHCTSNYPTDYSDVNMKAMASIRERFALPVGYSDHTLGMEIPIMAVAMGAEIIEKHFTLDCNMAGPDHNASLPAQRLAELVASIRNVEAAQGDGIKEPCEKELDTRKIARKSIVYSHNLNPGHILNANDLTIKRPGTGVPPYKLLSIIGQQLTATVQEEQLFSWEDIQER